MEKEGMMGSDASYTPKHDYLSQRLTHQVVQLWIFTEEGLVFSLLLVHKVFYVHIKAG